MDSDSDSSPSKQDSDATLQKSCDLGLGLESNMKGLRLGLESTPKSDFNHGIELLHLFQSWFKWHRNCIYVVSNFSVMWQKWMFNVRHSLHSFYQREKNKVEISRTFSCPCLSVLVLIQKNSFKSHMLLSKWDIKQKNLGSFFNVKFLTFFLFSFQLSSFLSSFLF